METSAGRAQEIKWSEKKTLKNDPLEIFPIPE